VEEVVHVIGPSVVEVTTSGEPKLSDGASRDVGAFVEVLDKHDSVLHRARYETLPITIGNTYRCDHIVDGEATTAHSVMLAHDDTGMLVVKTSEGAKFWAPGGATKEWIVRPDQAFVVAGERIRVRTRDYAPSRNAQPTSVIARFGGWTALVAVALALGVTALQGWLTDIDGDRLSKYVTSALAIFGGISIWAAIWAVVSRLNGKSSHFLAHLSLASLAVVAISAVNFSFDSAVFAFNWAAMSKYGYVVFALCIGVLVWCHTRYIVRTRLASALTAGIVFALAVFAMQATSYYNLRGNFASSLTMNDMRPPAWRIADGVSIEQFFNDAATLEKRAEDSKSEKPEGFDFGSYESD
jgi:hypothetical protein